MSLQLLPSQVTTTEGSEVGGEEKGRTREQAGYPTYIAFGRPLFGGTQGVSSDISYAGSNENDLHLQLGEPHVEKRLYHSYP